MATAKNKTIETKSSVSDFISAVADPVKQADSFRIIEIMEQLSGWEAKMWGPAIVGFGSYHYKYESGREGDSPIIGFSPRKDALTLYLALNEIEKDGLFKVFGKYKASKCCIYVKKLEDIKIPVLKKMISLSLKHHKKKSKQAVHDSHCC